MTRSQTKTEKFEIDEVEYVGTGPWAFPAEWLVNLPEWMAEAIERYPITLPLPTVPIGKWTHFSQVTCASLCHYVALGAPIGTACHAMGITPSVVYRWIECGEEEHADTAYGEFALNIHKAEAQFQVQALANIQAASFDPKHWTAAAWLLERKFPLEWGQLKRVERHSKSEVTKNEQVVIYIPENHRARDDGSLIEADEVRYLPGSNGVGDDESEFTTEDSEEIIIETPDHRPQ